ncbi:glycoside hydrolase [Tricladium varicosporioides]|nr:glycoside hydrolase [Hymenoscyphus varicosporioides]
MPNFNSSDMRCNVNATLAASGVLDVEAGTELGFVVDTIAAGGGIYHQGPLLGYMAKVPEGESVKGWDGSGRVWFKVYEDFPSWVVKTYGPIFEGASPVTYGKVTWPNEEVPILKLPIPAPLPNGEYLFRLESMALHFANPTIANRLGVQFYISCAQIRVSGGVEPAPGGAIEGMGEEYLTEFPGAYRLDDPVLNVFWSNQTEESYKKEPYMTRTPGPRVWKG